MSKKISEFFKGFIKFPLINYLVFGVFFAVNISNYCLLSSAKSSKFDYLGSYVSNISKKTTSNAINFSFVNFNDVDDKTIQYWANYAFTQSSKKTDIIGYETRFTMGGIPGGNNFNFKDALNKKAVGIICRDMGFYTEEVDGRSVYRSNQTKLFLEFPRKGSTQSDFKKGTTNFIYITESDANKLINTPDSDYYGLSHEELLGKGVGVVISYNNIVIHDKWKIDNIILETLNGELETNYKFLKNLYGDFFLSSMYGHSLSIGYSIDFELSTSAASNVRNIKRGLEDLDLYQFAPKLYSKDSAVQNNIDTANKLVDKILHSNGKDTIYLIISLVISAALLVFEYLSFSKTRKFKFQSMISLCVLFVIGYGLFFVLSSVSPLSFGNYLSEYAVLINSFLLLMSLCLIAIAFIGDDKESENELVKK